MRFNKKAHEELYCQIKAAWNVRYLNKFAQENHMQPNKTRKRGNHDKRCISEWANLAKRRYE
jgi:hypothetical protein